MGIKQNKDEQWMQLAIEQALLAKKQGEVPVGAVLVKDDQLISTGFNQVISLHDPTAHAEIITLKQAAVRLKNYRLPDCELYVTLEPCMMCAGSMIHARIKRVIFAAYDQKTGVIETVDSCLEKTYHNHQVLRTGGVLEDQCAQLLKDFFKMKRVK